MSRTKTTHALLVVAALAFALTGCNRASDESGTEEAAAQVALVEVQPAKVWPMQASVTAYGSAETSADRAEVVTVDVESRVSQVFVASGEPVRRGQALLRLNPSANSRLDVDKAVRDATAASAEAGRVARLREQGLATDAELAAAHATADSAVQLRDSLLARIGDGVTLAAPRAGVVDELKLQPGDLLPAGTAVARIVDPAAVIARLGVEPEDAARLRPQQQVVLVLLSAGASAVQGRVTHVDPRIDAQTRLATALVQVDPPAVLAPGTTLRGEIVVDRHEKAIVVPRSAVLYATGQPYVYVVQNGKAVRREVQTGFEDAEHIEVDSGVSAGDQVVVSGNYELADGMAVRVSPPKP